jgi:hypothetical protein
VLVVCNKVVVSFSVPTDDSEYQNDMLSHMSCEVNPIRLVSSSTVDGLLSDGPVRGGVFEVHSQGWILGYCTGDTRTSDGVEVMQ